MLSARVKIHSWPEKADIEAVVITQVKRYVAEIYNGVVMRSPVLTGSFRAAWTVSIGTPQFREVRNESGVPLAPPPFVFPSGYMLGQDLFIANGQPYAERIEYGWSNQAPHGVLRVTLASVLFK